MTGSIKTPKPAGLGSRRARNLPTLVFVLAAWLLLAAMLLAAGLTIHSEAASAHMLFQGETASPTTAPITATEDMTETILLPPPITPTATIVPTETPQPPPTSEPTATRTATPSPTVSAEPITTAQAGASSDSRRHYVRGDSNVTFDWGMLIDSLALGISYVWLVIGILVGVGLPILFVVLWVRTRRRRSAQE